MVPQKHSHAYVQTQKYTPKSHIGLISRQPGVYNEFRQYVAAL